MSTAPTILAVQLLQNGLPAAATFWNLENAHQIISTVFPLVFKLLSTGNWHTKFEYDYWILNPYVYAVKNWIVFPFLVQPFIAAQIKLELQEKLFHHLFHVNDNVSDLKKQLECLEKELAVHRKDHAARESNLQMQKAAEKLQNAYQDGTLQMKANHEFRKKHQELMFEIQRIEDQYDFEKKTLMLQMEKAQQNDVLHLDPCVGEFQPDEFHNVQSLKIPLQMSSDFVLTILPKVEKFVFTVNLTRSFPVLYTDNLNWVLAIRYMQSCILQPSSPVASLFDYGSRNILTVEGLLGSISGWNGTSNYAPTFKTSRVLPAKDADAITSYLNRAFFMVTVGSPAVGVLKFMHNGLPVMEVKSLADIKVEYAYLRFDAFFGPHKSKESVDAVKVWASNRLRNNIRQIVWIPWGGWPCSIITHLHGLDFPSYNNYLGFRYSLADLHNAFMKCPSSWLQDVKDMIFNNLCGAEMVQYNYVCKFYASILQFPFRKLGAILMLIGAGGIGKGIINSAVGHLLGNAYYHNKSNETNRKFNSDFADKCFIFFDEMCLDNGAYPWLKTAITESTQRIEKKFRDSYDQPSFWNCVGASNDHSLLRSNIDSSDRRFFFADCRRSKSLLHNQLAERVGKRMLENDYMLNKAFGYWLLSLDISDFDASKIPVTCASRYTQCKSEQNAVLVFFAEAIETESLLPPPGNQFIRYSESDITGINSARACASNPLGLDAAELENWKRWYDPEKKLWLIPPLIWKYMIDHCSSDFNVSQAAMERWMINGGWLTVLPASQVYHRFCYWLKTKGKSSANWTEHQFLESLRVIVKDFQLRLRNVNFTSIQFIEIPKYEITRDHFYKENPTFRLVDEHYSAADSITPAPMLSIMGSNSFNGHERTDYQKRLLTSAAGCPMLKDWIEICQQKFTEDLFCDDPKVRAANVLEYQEVCLLSSIFKPSPNEMPNFVSSSSFSSVSTSKRLKTATIPANVNHQLKSLKDCLQEEWRRAAMQDVKEQLHELKKSNDFLALTRNERKEQYHLMRIRWTRQKERAVEKRMKKFMRNLASKPPVQTDRSGSDTESMDESESGNGSAESAHENSNRSEAMDESESGNRSAESSDGSPKADDIYELSTEEDE